MKQWLLIGVLALVVGLPAAMADVYTFTYTGINNTSVVGSGTFTTGPAYHSGDPNSYLPIVSITGTTSSGAILGLDTASGPGVEPPNYVNDWNTAFGYDNAFKPTGANPFASGGLVFYVPPGLTGTAPYNAINIYGDGNGNTYEYSYAENGNPPGNPPGGNQITFTATLTPEPGFYGVLALGLSGLFVSVRRRRSA